MFTAGSPRLTKGLALIFAALAALAIWAAQGRAFDGPGFRLVVKTAASVDSDRVYLGDIAEPYGDISESRWAQLASTSMFEAPDWGDRPVVLSENQLKGLFLKHFGDLAYSCSYPGRLTVTRGGKVLDETAIRRKVVTFLTPLARKMGGSHEFKEFQLPKHIILPPDYAGLEVELGGKMKAGRVPLRLNVVTIDGKVDRQYAAGVFMNLWAPVACAARPVNRGDLITPDKVTFVTKNQAYLARETWNGKGGPWRLKTPVGTRQVIYADNLEPMPAVTRGDKVDLVYEGRHIQLQAEAEAMGDGAPGEKIVVRNLHSRKKIQAVVRDSQTVVVN